MKIRDYFKGGGNKANVESGRQTPDASARTGWDGLRQPKNGGGEKLKTPAELNAERQQRKIIASMALGDMSPFYEHDVQVDQQTRDAILEQMATGQISQDFEDKIVNGIRGPLDVKDGYQNAFANIDGSRQMRRILSYMSRNDFDGWQTVGEADLHTFMQKYPNPRDFDQASANFLDMIRRGNPEAKYQQYVDVMDNFKSTIYGKKQEYFDQITALHDEANNHTIRGRGNIPTAPRRMEQERSSEWMTGKAGFWQTSRDQARGGQITRENVYNGLWANNSCEDSILVRDQDGVYGVFDGAGGHQGGRRASETTATVVNDFCETYKMESGSSLAAALNAANEAVVRDPDAGLSTAVLTKVIDRNGRKMLAYAAAGDSRIYIVDKNGQARQITKDEGEGRYIYNAIGKEAEYGESLVQQFGEVDLRKGDRVVLCSDGITGDYGSDLMSNDELGRIVARAHDGDTASRDLIAGARKNDDRSVIVFGDFR